MKKSDNQNSGFELTDYRKQLLQRLEKVATEFRRSILLFTILSAGFALVFLVPFVELRSTRAATKKEILDNAESLKKLMTTLKHSRQKSARDKIERQETAAWIEAVNTSARTLLELSRRVSTEFQEPLEKLMLSEIPQDIEPDQSWSNAPWDLSDKVPANDPVLQHYLVLQSLRQRIAAYRAEVEEQIVRPLLAKRSQYLQLMSSRAFAVVDDFDNLVTTRFRQGLTRSREAPSDDIWEVDGSNSNQIYLAPAFRSVLFAGASSLLEQFGDVVDDASEDSMRGLKKLKNNAREQITDANLKQSSLELLEQMAKQSTAEEQERLTSFRGALEEYRGGTTELRDRHAKQSDDLKVQFKNAVSFFKLNIDLDVAVLVFPLLTGAAFLLCCVQFADAARLRRALFAPEQNTDGNHNENLLRLMTPVPLADPRNRKFQLVPVSIALLIQIGACATVLCWRPSNDAALEERRAGYKSFLEPEAANATSEHSFLYKHGANSDSISGLELDVSKLSEEIRYEFLAALTTEWPTERRSVTVIYLLSFLIGSIGMVWGIWYAAQAIGPGRSPQAVE